MPGNIPVIQHPNFTPVSTNLGDAPLGKIGNRSVEAGKPDPTRAGEPSFGTKVSNFFARALDALTPSTVRAEGKFHRSLEKFSGELGNTLGALSPDKKGKIDAQQVLDSLVELTKASQDLSSRGGNSKEAILKQLDIHLSKLTNENVKALAAGFHTKEMNAVLDELQRSDSPEELKAAMMIEQAINKEALLRVTDSYKLTIQTIFDNTIKQIPLEAANPGAVDFVFRSAHGKASEHLELLNKLGATSIGDREAANYASQLVKEGLSKLPADKLSQILQNVSTGELLDLAQGVSSPETAEVDAAIAREIPARTDRLTADFTTKADKVLAHSLNVVEDPNGSLHNPVGSAKEFIDVASTLTNLKKHAAKHGITLPASVDAKIADLVAHSEKLLKPDNLNIGELSNTTLHKLDVSLKSMGVESPKAAITTEATARRTAAEVVYKQTLDAALGAILGGNTEAVFNTIVAANKSANELLTTANQLGAGLDEPPKIMAFRKQLLLAHVTASYTQDQLIQLFGALKTDTMRTLPGLIEVAYEFIQTHPDLGKSILNSVVDVTLLEEAVTNSLKAQGISIPQFPDESEATKADLSLATKTAVLNAFNVEVSVTGDSNLKAGFLSEEGQEIYSEFFNSPLPDSAIQKQQVGDRELDVCTIFYKDFTRSSQFIEQGGQSEKILHYNNALSSEEANQRIDAGLARLLDLCGGNKQQLYAISQYANQGSFAGLAAVLGNKDASPLRMPDGTSGSFISFLNNISFTYSQGDEGNVIITANWLQDQVRTILDVSTGNQVYLDPTKSSANFTLEITVSPDGKATLSKPVSFAYQAEKSLWIPDYEQPRNIDEVIIDSSAFQDFQTFAATRHASESIDFYQAVHEFDGNPTLEKAREIRAKYIGEDAPNQINIQGTVSARIATALDIIENSPHRDIVSIFDASIREVDHLLETNGIISAFASRYPEIQPAPHTVKDILDTKNKDLIAEFETQLRERLVDENLEFYKAAMDFKANPTLVGAARIESKYISQNAERRINISGDMEKDVSTTLTTLSVLPKLFSEAATEIRGLIQANLFDDFVASHVRAE